MPKYIITMDIVEASGYRQIAVVADSKESALAKYNETGGLFHAEELHAVALAAPSLENIEEVED